MQKEKILTYVQQEIDNLREYATDEQKSKLDFSNFDPDKVHYCIYGQMTGNCYSQEAIKLMKKCLVKGVLVGSDPLVSEIIPRYKFPFSRRHSLIYRRHSVLENFIVFYPENNEDIIKYIKGDINELNLEVE